MYSMKQGSLGVQTLFYILMAFIFVWIIVFGIQQIAGIGDQLSETERLEIRSDIQSNFEYCENPLNDGAKRTVEFSHNAFDIVCIVGEDIKSRNPCENNVYCNNLIDAGVKNESKLIEETYTNGETPVILLKGTYTELDSTQGSNGEGVGGTDTKYSLDSAQIVDDFSIRLRSTQEKTVCWYSADNNFEGVRIVSVC